MRNAPSCFEDYEAVKSDIIHLKEFVKIHSEGYTLIHNDLSCENCLLYCGENGEEKCILIDFEYAAMQCPAADIAYFCVFSDLNESEVDAIIKEYFEDEYRAHIYDKKCPAGACQKLKTIWIDPELCKGCSKCARNCPVGAIKGEIKKPFVIDNDKCIKCGACISTCPFKAIKEN